MNVMNEYLGLLSSVSETLDNPRGSVGHLDKMDVPDIKIIIWMTIRMYIIPVPLAREEHHLGVRVVERHQDPRRHVQLPGVEGGGQVPGVPDDQLPGAALAEPGGQDPVLRHPDHL